MKCFEDLIQTTKRLRAPKGCPWDQKQTHHTLIKCMREECEEAVAAIENNDFENLREELGDVLLQVLFHANIAEEEGKFTLENVITDLNAKLIRRHPHVFGGQSAGTPEEALAMWKSMKQKEREAK